MSKWIRYVGDDGKNYLKFTNEYIRQEEEKIKKKYEEQNILEKKRRNNFWLNMFLKKKRIKIQKEYIENYILKHPECKSIVIRRFFSKVDIKDENECWNWIGSNRCNGYGGFDFESKIMLSHRVSYILANNEIIENIEICHKCDNSSCVNPNHLYAGTHADNMKDMVNKGRNPNYKKENNPNVKLTQNKVDEIRKLYSTGRYHCYTLAKMFSVSKVI